jgi:hypothetical protein
MCWSSIAPNWLIAPSEALVAADVGVLGFVHIDAVFAREPADQPGRHRASLRSGNAAGEGRQTLLRQQMLEQDIQAIGHRERRTPLPPV